MSTTKKSAGALTGITITAATLANGAARESLKVDNSGAGAKFLDAMLHFSATLAAGTPTADTAGIEVYAYGSLDGTVFTDNATGVDAALTMRSRPNLPLIARLETPDAGALTYKGVIGSIASAFGGMLPEFWGVVVVNRTGLAFTAFSASYQGIYATHQ